MPKYLLETLFWWSRTALFFGYPDTSYGIWIPLAIVYMACPQIFIWNRFWWSRIPQIFGISRYPLRYPDTTGCRTYGIPLNIYLKRYFGGPEMHVSRYPLRYPDTTGCRTYGVCPNIYLKRYLVVQNPPNICGIPIPIPLSAIQCGIPIPFVCREMVSRWRCNQLLADFGAQYQQRIHVTSDILIWTNKQKL